MGLTNLVYFGHTGYTDLSFIMVLTSGDRTVVVSNNNTSSAETLFVSLWSELPSTVDTV